MKIIALGETTFDVIFKGGKPIDSKVGGSVTNMAVSLGRLGVPVKLVAACGSDEIGLLTRDFLQTNHIDTTFLMMYEGTTRIAVAFLDYQNNARYNLYNGIQYDNQQLVFPYENFGDIVVFGSSFGIQAKIRLSLVNFLNGSVQKGNIIFYDPNVRPGHLTNNSQAKDWIIENIRLSNIVKGSCEDFNLLFSSNSSQNIYHKIKYINPKIVLIVTADRNGADLFTPLIHKHIQAPSIEPVSTIGAGDAFSAGIIYGLYQLNTNPDNLLDLSESSWDLALGYAVRFATEVCLSQDNYIVR